MNARDFAELIDHAKQTGDGYTGRCPAHEDETPSLSFTDGDKGLVFHCHRGCSQDEVITALGLKWADLFPESSNGHHPPTAAAARRIVATYPYRDLDGQVIAETVRYEPKGFAQRRPDVFAGWIWNLGDTPRVLYRLPEIQGAVEVVVAEGEKEADALAALGFAATTSVMGAGKWKDVYAEQLRHAGVQRVIVIPDNDTAGHAHALQVVQSCRAHGLDARIVPLPGLPPIRPKHGEDVSDWLASGHTADDLRALLAAAPPLRDPASLETAPAAAVSWRLWDGAETWGFPPPLPLIDDLLMLDGVTWVGGRPKSFKTLVVLYLCLCIAARRAAAANHFKIQATPRILYVGREDGGARFELRRDEILAAWTDRPELGAIRFLIREHVDLLNPAHVSWLRDTCRRESITVLVLDTWTALSPSADPMAAKDQAQLAAVVVQLAQDIAGQVIVVDHSRKNRPDGQPLSAADIFGPLQKWAAADNTIMLERVGSSFRVEVYVEGKDIDSSQCFLEVSPRGSGLEKFTYAGTVAEIAEAQRAIGDKNRQAIRLVVSTSTTPLSCDEIRQRLLAQEIKLAHDTVKNHLGHLVKSGVLRVLGQGRATKYAVAVGRPSSPIVPPIQEPLYDPAT